MKFKPMHFTPHWLHTNDFSLFDPFHFSFHLAPSPPLCFHLSLVLRTVDHYMRLRWYLRKKRRQNQIQRLPNCKKSIHMNYDMSTHTKMKCPDLLQARHTGISTESEEAERWVETSGDKVLQIWIRHLPFCILRVPPCVAHMEPIWGACVCYWLQLPFINLASH